MRKLYTFFLGLVAVTLILFGVSVYMQKISSSSSQSDKLVIYNWGDYIDPEIIKNSLKKQVSRFSTKPLILMSLCIPRLSRVEQLTTSPCRQIT